MQDLAGLDMDQLSDQLHLCAEPQGLTPLRERARDRRVGQRR